MAILVPGSNGGGGGGSNGSGSGEFLEDLDSITDLLPLHPEAQEGPLLLVDQGVIKDVEAK